MPEQSEASLTESEIGRLVDAFYARVRLEPTIGPIFNARIDDWPAHLELLKSFWSSALLGTGTFKGNPLETHLKLALEPTHFRIWLDLFARTASEILPPSHTAIIIDRSQRIARTFQLAISNQAQPLTIVAKPA